ncbi:hypothetical protein NGB58_25565, partial [Escherichia coli]|nr:hypothetical protein [Escherichia coli]
MGVLHISDSIIPVKKIGTINIYVFFSVKGNAEVIFCAPVSRETEDGNIYQNHGARERFICSSGRENEKQETGCACRNTGGMFIGQR